MARPSLLQLGAALIASVIPGGQGVAAALTISAIFTEVAGAFLKPDKQESDFSRASPTYGFGQWRNPVKGDAAIPVIYTGDAHKHAPVWLQAYVTPKGTGSADFAKVLKAKGQAFSALFAVAEGPIVDIEDIRINDEPLFERVTDYELSAATGARKVFKLPHKRIVERTLKVYVDGALKGWKSVTKTWRRFGAGSVIREAFTVDERIDESVDPVITVNGTAIDTTSPTALRPRVWFTTDRTFVFDSQEAVPTGTKIDVTLTFLELDGFKVTRKDGKTRVVFDTAPAKNAKVTATFDRLMFPGVEVDWRLGSEHQLPLPGFESVRNSYGSGSEVEKNSPVTITTNDEVDDVALLLTSGPSGFTVYDDEGNRSRATGQFRLEVKLNTASTAGNVFDTWQIIPDPAGKIPGRKGADEFEIRADSTSGVTWAFSVRGLIRQYIEKHPNNADGKKRARDFVRAKYQVRLTRTNANKSATNTRYVDDFFLSTWQEVIDEWLSYPGVALLAIHGIASSKLQGSAPNVTCSVTGKADVQAWDGSAWSAGSTNQGNRVWAVIDLLTNTRYGGGSQFALANIDTTSAKAAADWLDENVNVTGSITETRSRLDIICDTRKSPLAWAADILRPGMVWPVLQGNVWKFVIDQGVDTASLTTIWDDTTDADTGEDSLRAYRDSRSRVPSEIQLAFLEDVEDFDRKHVWISPQAPGDERRIQRIDGTGTTRRTEAVRYANHVYTQARSGGLTLNFSVRPERLDLEAGDVFRFRSSRIGFNGTWRVARLSWGTRDYFVRVEAIPYVPAVYGQQGLPFTVLESSVRTQRKTALTPVVSTPTTIDRDTVRRGARKRFKVRKFPVKVRRVS